jgi:sec-independent protein translocase protein TatA
VPGFIGPTEIIILLVVALLVFGPKRLPEMGRSIGKGMREFKDSVSGKDEDAAPAELPAGDEPVVTPKSDTTS